MNRKEHDQKTSAIDGKMDKLKNILNEQIGTANIKKGTGKDVLAAKRAAANARLQTSKAAFKEKATAEILKAQNSINEAKARLAEKKNTRDPAKLEDYIDDVIAYAGACVELSILAADEADLAIVEAVEAIRAYESLSDQS